MMVYQIDDGEDGRERRVRGDVELNGLERLQQQSEATSTLRFKNDRDLKTLHSS